MEEENEEGLDFAKNFRFAEDFDVHNGEYFLLQVPKCILEELQAKKEMSMISRDFSDVAKLVSSGDTYKLKKYDYPNTYFLN